MSSGRRRVSTAATVGAALLTLLAVFAIGNYSADAHPLVHPQKKLFSARWYKPSVDLTASPPWFGIPTQPGVAAYPCDGGIDTASCVAKWQGPAYASWADWNNQPDTARFYVQGYRDHNWDNNIYIVDSVPGSPPGLLGYATYHNQSGQSCIPDPYPGYIYCSVYRYSDAVIIDNNHTGPYGTAQSRQATITHELGHVLSLRHESVNIDESQRYPCGLDNTGPIPVSVMSYDCVAPPGYGEFYGSGIYTVQDWDVCGVNHAYPDPAYEWEKCICYPPPSGSALPALPAAYYHPMTPARILDTRPAPFGPIGGTAGRLGHGCHQDVQVTGVGGVPPVSSGVSAVVVNVTATQPSLASHLTIYPSNASLPNAANLNFVAGQTVPNLVTVRVGTDGRVRVFNNSGQTHLVFDVVGWYDSTPATAPGTPPHGPGTVGGMSAMSIDMDGSDNNANQVVDIDACARINENDFLDADEDIVDGLTFDTTAQGIPAFSDNGTPADPADDSGGITGYQYQLNYPSVPFTVTNQVATNSATNKVASNFGSSISNASDALPDDNTDNVWTSSVQDTSASSASTPEDVDGVLDRLTITTESGAVSGQYAITLTNEYHTDATGTPKTPNSGGLANVAVNQSCGPLVQEGGYYHPVPPYRIRDTRSVFGGPIGGPAGKIGPGGKLDVQVTGVAGSNVPPDTSGVTAVAVNVTVTEPTAPSHLTVYPTGSPPNNPPNAANLNFVAGQTVPNLVIMKVGLGGKVTVFNNSGSTHVIFDIVGWYGSYAGVSPTDNGSLYNALQPKRILDTRGVPFGPIGVPVAGKIAAGDGAILTLDVTNTLGSGVPDPPSVTAVILNTTVTEPTAPSHLTVYPSDVGSVPNAANLNFVTGQTVPNLVIVKIGNGGKVKIRNNSGQTHVIFDVVGYFGPAN